MTLTQHGEGVAIPSPSTHLLLWLIWNLRTHRDLISTVSKLFLQSVSLICVIAFFPSFYLL